MVVMKKGLASDCGSVIRGVPRLENRRRCGTPFASGAALQRAANV